MAKKLCICKICGKQFDRNSEQAVIAGPRRYAHQTCLPDGELVPMEVSLDQDPDLRTLNDYILKIYGDKANWALIKKQIKKFYTEYNYSYSGMLKSLIYFYEIKHNKIEDSNGGIGIIEFVYENAKKYFYNIWLTQNNNEDKTLVQQVKEYIFKPKKFLGTKNKILEWGEEDEIE